MSSLKTDDCIFCKISKKEIESKIIYEDDKCICFPDMFPKDKIHLLIIPKVHLATLNDFQENDSALIAHLMLVAPKIAKLQGFAEYGYKVQINCNSGGGQEIFHLHLHLISSYSK